MNKISKISTNLWFNDQAEEAVTFYTKRESEK
jgi:predicted 3-demethylubiquinone-9 3-methyltransferase (glyoxalase superfamily)